ncbi:MAG: chemotaxis protein CheW [Desulfobacteraceae bacterium]
MKTHQFVTFKLEGYLLGLHILEVREINRLLDITPVQRAPEYVFGLVNLRGQTVTVLDLGIRLGLGPREITDETHNIILKQEPVGLLVDDIGDVEEADEGAVESPPANLNGIGTEFVYSVVKLHNELLVVLSLDKILTASQKPAQPPLETK